MSIVYKVMGKKEMDQVQKLIPAVFAELFARETGRPHYLPMRTKAEMSSYMDKSPEGSLVAVLGKRKVIGCVFCHRWGDTGWLGPMVVDQAHQGKGIGTRLLQIATDYMVDTECRVIGLETMPQTIGNVGLYLRHGYYPGNLRIRLAKEIVPEGLPDEESLIYCLDRQEAVPYLQEIARTSRAVDPLVDYTDEIEASYRYELGRCFFWRVQDEIQGFMLYHWLPASSRVVIKAMACNPGPDSLTVFSRFLSSCESVLAQEGMRQLIAPVYGEHQGVLKILLETGYRVMHAGVRMFYRRDESHQDLSRVVHLSQWSG